MFKSQSVKSTDCDYQQLKLLCDPLIKRHLVIANKKKYGNIHTNDKERW